jgi:protoporphyrin/coproporphyrin ferrochelatase
MAHGTPSTPEEIGPFYTSIRRGRPPTAEQLAELQARYGAIGGTSPLRERTGAQVAGLTAALASAEPGRFRVEFGAKHTAPSIEDAVATLAADGVSEIVGLVLTPHRSSVGSGEYFERARRATETASPPITFVPIPSWHRADGVAALLAERTATAIDSLEEKARSRVVILFTAHSVPLRSLAEGDPYPVQVAESAADVADLLGLGGPSPSSWEVAWQSAGRTPDPWLGPDLLGEIRRAGADDATAVVVCPVGFVSDHLEILYDLDVEAAGVAADAGLAFARTESLNDHPRFLAALAGVVRAAAERR